MYWSDNVTRGAFSYDKEDASKGVRIFQQQAEADKTGTIKATPQLIVSSAIGQVTWAPAASRAGERQATIVSTVLLAPNTAFLPADITEFLAMPNKTAETYLTHLESVLNRGTLWSETDHSQYLVIDPFNSPLNEDGTYDMDQRRDLTSMTPTIRRAAAIGIPRKQGTSVEEAYKLNPVTELAVGYSTLATYLIDITDSGKMHLGGN